VDDGGEVAVEADDAFDALSAEAEVADGDDRRVVRGEFGRLHRDERADALGGRSERGVGVVIEESDDPPSGECGGLGDDGGVAAAPDEEEAAGMGGRVGGGGGVGGGHGISLENEVQRRAPSRVEALYHAGMESAPNIIESKPMATAVGARVGAVSYLNTRPMIAGLDRCADLDITLAAPSGLLGMLDSGAVDVALAPIFDAQQAGHDVALLPCGMIGSAGETLTVRLLSVDPIETITRVRADVESRTSVALLRVLFRKLHGVDVEVIPFDARRRTAGADAVEWPDAVLLIGDKVVTGSAPAGRHRHQMDLGEAWRGLTGLPFVYAAWMCRADRIGDEAVNLAQMALDHQRRHNAMRADWVVNTEAPLLGWPTGLARRYLGELLSYEPGAAHREAIELFFEMAHEIGLIDERRSVVWADGAEMNQASPCLV